MALEEGIPYKLGHCFPGKLSPVKGCAKDCLTGFWWADVPAHTHGFMNYIRHPGFKTYAGQDTFGRCVSHLYGCNNKIGFVLVFGNVHSRTMGN